MSAESGIPQPDTRLPTPEYIPRGTYTPPAYTPVPPPSEWHHGHYAETAAAPAGGSGAGHRGRGLAGGAAAIGALLLKLGPTLFKFKTIVYLLINVGVYAFFFGSNFGLVWALALGLGILVLLFLHETGHMVAAEIEGVPVSAPNFIPGFGAYIMLKAQPRDAKTESIIAIGGPLFGALPSLATIGLANTVGTATKPGLLLAVVAGYSFFFHAINMIPYTPLAGRRRLRSG